jgi:hypothetical protein
VRAVRGKWGGPGGANPPAGAPSAACHWPPEGRTSPAMPSHPLHGLVARHVPTYPNRPSRTLISESSPSLARMPACPSRRHPPFRRSVSIVLRSFSSRTSEPQPFPVNDNTSLSPESEPPRTPPDRRRRARSSATSPSLVTCLVPSLGHIEASWAARG